MNAIGRIHGMRRIAVVTAVVTAVAASLASCAGDAPTVPRVLRLQPVFLNSIICSDICTPSASGQFTSAGSAVTITLQVADQDNNPVAGIAVRWTVQNGSGSTDVSSSTSDSTGLAAVHWTLDTTAKLDTIQASLSPAMTLTATATGRPGSPAIATKISGDAQTVAAGATSQPFVVKLTDRYGNPIPNFTVAWAPAGFGTIAEIATKTDSAGIARTSLTADAGPGAYRAIASFANVPALIFTRTAK
jgi:hypothetical protein